MSQSQVPNLVSKLRFKVGPRRKLRNPQGSEGRLMNMRKTVTALIKHERIELNMPRADEARGYAERIISDAIRYGPCHKETMEMASYWLLEENLVHKLFKVLVPRYQNCTKSYTKVWKAPSYSAPAHTPQKCLLELRDNVYPSLVPENTNNKNFLHNILLEEAKKDYALEKKLKMMAESVEEKLEIEEEESRTLSEENSLDSPGEETPSNR